MFIRFLLRKRKKPFTVVDSERNIERGIMIFKKIIAALLVVSALFAVSVNAVNAAPALWVSEKDGHKTYFLGSVHLLPKDVVWYGPKIKSAFESANEVIFEIDMSDPQMQSKAVSLMGPHVRLPIGQTLKTILNEETYKRSMQIAKNLLGAPEAGVAGLQPWFLSLQFAVVSMTKMGLDPNAGVDKVILKMAVAKKIKISGLETIETQMNIIARQKMPVQITMLEDTLDQLDDLPKYMNKLLDAWKAADESIMVRSFLDDMKESPEFYDTILVKRNKAWVPVLEKLMAKKQNNFVVVGTAHLVGEDSILKMLKDKGYKISRVQ
jgi:uncharacterized protein YbaP (TraB family)